MNTNQKMIDELEILFKETTPNQLKQSVVEVFMDFLMNNKSNLPYNFEQLVDNFNYLIIFLEKADINNSM